MKGKNLGKKRIPRKRQPNASEPTALTRRPHPLPEPSVQVSAPGVPFGVGDALSGMMSPFDLTPQDRKTIYRFMVDFSDVMYPSHFYASARELPSVFFNYMFVDEAYFHGFIAMTAAFSDFITGQHTRTASNAHHLGLALRLTNARLSGSDALSDTTLASVIALCLFENMTGDVEKMAMHFDGLCRMIALRSGVKTNLTLLEKARRLDIDLALQTGQPLRLDFEPVPDICYPFSLSCDLPPPLDQSLREADLGLYLVTRDVMKMTRLLSLGVAPVKPTLQEAITALFYRLLSIDTIAGGHLQEPLARTVHTILLAVMTTSIIQFDRQRCIKYGLLSRQCAARLNDSRFLATMATNPEDHIWMLIVAESAILSPEEDVWLIPRIHEIACRLGISEWSEAKMLLEKYPWIPSLHEKPAMLLWGR
ncbi:hypothetical protein B0T10DRAFT_502639 [Thelonectria olida]|uniref:Uncharacterized protein n=1 Tax=Thelonectria olida TaxID=1576542 RepID=A0A9P9AH17_9HYPO|nr:hypothetical protein B0T10DRAFT_502639 [Thelonectria olida]